MTSPSMDVDRTPVKAIGFRLANQPQHDSEYRWVVRSNDEEKAAHKGIYKGKGKGKANVAESAQKRKRRREEVSYDSVQIIETGEVISVGDVVEMHSPDDVKDHFLALVEKLWDHGYGTTKELQVRWFYRHDNLLEPVRRALPAEVLSDQVEEAFISDVRDTNNLDAVVCKAFIVRRPPPNGESLPRRTYLSRLSYSTDLASDPETVADAIMPLPEDFLSVAKFLPSMTSPSAAAAG
ncbi:unnamed protein product, partial [Choristocarpus tenellus]